MFLETLKYFSKFLYTVPVETKTALPAEPSSRFVAQIKQLADFAAASAWISGCLRGLNLRFSGIVSENTDDCLAETVLVAQDAEAFMSAARQIAKVPGAQVYFVPSSGNASPPNRCFYAQCMIESICVCCFIREEFVAAGYDLESFVAACQINAPIAMPRAVAA